MRARLTTLAELAGAAVLCYGVSMLSVPAALIVAGVLLIAGGIGAAT